MANHHVKCKHARPRIQREFLSWFAESRHLFNTPLSITKHTKRIIELSFANAGSMISVTLTSWEINTHFEWNGVFWDYLSCFEAIPKQKGSVYICDLCDPGESDLYLNRELLWRLHLFEPFLEWVNGTLTKAPWIEVYGHADHCTAATLFETLPVNKALMASDNEDSLIITNPLYKSD